jgi:3-phosphoshikimate 1-carboxyvinyltransferase
MKALHYDLKNAPDLFPVLAILCANSEGESLLFGAKHLVNKESNRIEAISQLLDKIGRKHQKKDDGILIEKQSPAYTASNFTFSSFNDHRIAFAAGLAIAMGCKIELDEPRVVEKSFSSFWSVLRKGGLNDVPSAWT